MGSKFQMTGASSGTYNWVSALQKRPGVCGAITYLHVSELIANMAELQLAHCYDYCVQYLLTSTS